MDDRLYLLIEKYRNAVAECMRIMRECANGSDTWKGDLEPEGEFPEYGIGHYYLYGRGLRVQRGDIVIDCYFDAYAEGDYIIGFYPYFISQYAKSSFYPDVEFWNVNEIEGQLEEWHKLGLAHPPYTFEMSYLWYLERDVHRLDLDKWTEEE